MPDATAVTVLLGRWRSGDADALQELTPLVYGELRRLAGRYLVNERSDHTLQPTALVNEAFVRLAGSDVPWADRAHFFAVAARTMRHVLIDYAKARNSQKRGGDLHRVDLTAAQLSTGPVQPDLLDVDAALRRLEAIDPVKCEVLVLHYFGGLTYEETAEALGLSAATVDRHLRLGKAWLDHELRDA